MIKFPHPAGITSILQIQPIDNFHSTELSYVIARDKLNVTLVNIKEEKAYWLFKEKQCDTTLY
jgi:hypothetical protein